MEDTLTKCTCTSFSQNNERMAQEKIVLLVMLIHKISDTAIKETHVTFGGHI
jgi:hypothetical protein